MDTEKENQNKRNKRILAIVCNILAIIIFILFAYKGFFPFNIDVGKRFHYLIYDAYHILFNISNFEYNNHLYYCKSIYKEKIIEINKNIVQIDLKNQDIQNKINALIYSKNNITDNDYNKIQSLYDTAHVLHDDYYIHKADNEIKIIQNKLEHNKNIDKQIKLLNIMKNNNEIIKDIEKRKILQYCIELL